MEKIKYYAHDYKAVADVESYLSQLIADVRREKYDLATVIKLLEPMREKLRAYLGSDNLVESEEGSLMLRDDENLPATEILRNLCFLSDECGGEASVTSNTPEGFRVKISARKLTDEEKGEDYYEEEEE